MKDDFNIPDIYEAPKQRPGTPVRPRGRTRSARPGLSVDAPELICIALLVVEAILLFVFADALFYRVVVPILELILLLGSGVVWLASIATTLYVGFRSLFNRKDR